MARTDRAAVRKFVKPLDDDGRPGELAGFAVATAVTGAPILAIAAGWLDCVVQDALTFHSHTLFVGEVADCGGGPAADGDEEVLRMEDTRMSYGG
jgi:flavin reductase (DIM6/NTAB) family NADH-FMN oxidoreductase RutF